MHPPCMHEIRLASWTIRPTFEARWRHRWRSIVRLRGLQLRRRQLDIHRPGSTQSARHTHHAPVCDYGHSSSERRWWTPAWPGHRQSRFEPYLAAIRSSDSWRLDHHLVTWSLATRMLPPRKLITFFHRNLKGIDTKKFQDDILASAVYTEPADTVDGFTEQLEQTVGDILEQHCPLRKRTKFASARKDGHWLSDDAVSAKRERRRLERKWKTSGDEQDRVKYRKHCRVTNKKIIGARRKFYQDRIVEAGKDPRRRWSVIHNVLHATS